MRGVDLPVGRHGDLSPLVDLIRREEEFILATHVNPDGDAIGSLLGLGLLFRKMGKRVFVGHPANGELPPQYSFLPGKEFLRGPSECPSQPTCFIAIDCANLERLGKMRAPAQKARLLINLDHHRDNTRFGHLNVVDESYSATAEIIFTISQRLGQKLDRDIATCLYTGIVTDTGRFQYSNTNQRTFQVAQEMLAYGVSPAHIFQNVYENLSFPCLKLLGRVLDRAKFLPEKGIAYSFVSQRDLPAVGGAEMEETENFVDLLRAVKEAEVAAILKEMTNGTIKVSLRSKGKIDVSKLAEKFRGGGHPSAAGFSSPYDLEKTIDVLLKLLESDERHSNCK